MTKEPCFDVAHLGHVELYSDRFEESLDFFTRVYGLTETARAGESSYLRAFDDYEHHTLKLTRYGRTGVGHIGYRCSSAPALQRRVAAIEAAGYGGAGPTATWATARPTASRTPSGTNSNSTGKPTDTPRRPTSARR